MYCSQAHQVEHWKGGHKLICGSSSVPPNSQKLNKSEFPFEVKECETGQGGFAKRTIKRGEKILNERPLIVVKSEYSSLDEAEDRADEAYDKLDAAGKETLDSLFNAFPERGRAGLIQTNAYPVDEAHGAVFPCAARMNHSCTPNANQSWNEEAREQRLFALKDINPGEEIFISYISTATMTFNERQFVLSNYFRFDCMCKLCVKCDDDPEFRKASDKNRSELARVKELVANPRKCTAEKAIEAVKTAKELIEAENIAFSELGPICFDAYVICVKSDRHQVEAKDFITTAYQAYKISCGSEDSTTKLARSLMEGMTPP